MTFSDEKQQKGDFKESDTPPSEMPSPGNFFRRACAIGCAVALYIIRIPFIPVLFLLLLFVPKHKRRTHDR